MESLAESMPGQAAMPRFEDGSINLRELMRRLAEDVVNAIMDAEADQLCAGGANSRNGYRERNLVTCVGDITLRIPKLRTGSFFPEDVVERYQRVDRAVVAAVAEMYATGTVTAAVTIAGRGGSRYARSTGSCGRCPGRAARRTTKGARDSSAGSRWNSSTEGTGKASAWISSWRCWTAIWYGTGTSAARAIWAT